MKFQKAVFLGHVTFSDRLFEKSVNFDGSFFATAPLFHQSTLHRDTSFLKSEFFAAPGASSRRVEKIIERVFQSIVSKMDGESELCDDEDLKLEADFWAEAGTKYDEQRKRYAEVTGAESGAVSLGRRGLG